MASAKKLLDKTKEQMAEILRCGKNPVYFIKKYVKISHPIDGVIPFDLFPFQEDCIKSFKEHRFNITLKSRQIGITTVTAAYVVWMCMFQKDKNVLVIATKLSTAQGFINKVKLALEHVPKYLFLSDFTPTSQCVKFANGSRVTAIATSENAGRSEAVTFLIVDEAAYVRGFDTIWTALKPTLSTGGSAIVLSTPNGVGNQFHKLWVDAVAGQNSFNYIMLPWHVHPQHDQAWFDNETRGSSRSHIAQEYECSFLSSGNTYFTPEVLDKVLDDIRTPLEKTGHQNCVWVWEKPSEDAKYVMSADVSRGDSKDFSAFHIIDCDTLNVVVEFVGKIPPDEFAVLLAEWGKKYNDALMTPENNTYGYMVFMKLKELKYPRIYYETAKDDPFNYTPDEDDEEIGGITTSASNRNHMLAVLEEYMRTCRLVSRSQRLYDQLQTLVWNGKRAEAAKNSYDDAIMSLAIGCLVLSTFKTTRKQSSNTIYKTILGSISSSRTPSRGMVSPSIDFMSNRYKSMIGNSLPSVYAKTGYSQMGKMMRELGSRQQQGSKFDVTWVLR